jgi:hypothetical protein
MGGHNEDIVPLSVEEGEEERDMRVFMFSRGMPPVRSPAILRAAPFIKMER